MIKKEQRLSNRELIVMLRMSREGLREGAQLHREAAYEPGVSGANATRHNMRFLRMSSYASMDDEIRRVLINRLLGKK